MNIDDVPVSSITIPDDPMGAIFDHQRKLMEKYEPIEARKGLLIPDHPWHIDAFKVQNRIKDLFWRTTEEIAEAFEEFMRNDFELLRWRDRWDDDPAIRHFFEEIADALHFLVEATIYAGAQGVCPTAKVREWIRGNHMERAYVYNGDEMRSWEFIMALGLAANHLKNKPWKQTEMPTDRVRFIKQLEKCWQLFAEFWGCLPGTLDDLYILYCRKNLVNQFRQRTNY